MKDGEKECKWKLGIHEVSKKIGLNHENVESISLEKTGVSDIIFLAYSCYPVASYV